MPTQTNDPRHRDATQTLCDWCDNYPRTANAITLVITLVVLALIAIHLPLA